ncbi:hypothetical protein I532_17878 [Brevibacillus borstelensis AK1]|uniref:Uncharacterized protein n=1 Tax=Brevibacillus borstelensis AK1 TaxID=1300222 RepID=M8DDI5_9BACL|nr:hypothetical protein I532_17878 [Brevibacillus borstelensis AK1]KKX54966.1 hypothetical protein X546_12265 [Brevibacillus borstelensis cifa_chp40]
MSRQEKRSGKDREVCFFFPSGSRLASDLPQVSYRVHSRKLTRKGAPIKRSINKAVRGRRRSSMIVS